MVSNALILKHLHITLVVALYWIISMATVFVNKSLLSSKIIDLDAPFFVVWFQCLVSVGVCLLMKVLSSLYPKLISFPPGSPFALHSIKLVLPVTLFFDGMIIFNTLCLKFADVTYYYIGRSLTTVFNVALTFYILKEEVSYNSFICCIIIVLGFFMGIDQESVAGTLSIKGAISGVLASFSLSLYSIYNKKVLPALGNHIWLLAFFNNAYSCILLLPMILLNGELDRLWNYDKLFSSDFWTLMLIGGICGFSIGYVTSLQIQVTSPLTHNVSGTAKACVQTIIAAFWYDEIKSLLWWFSNMIVLFGSAAYTAVKQKELQLMYSYQKPG
ncbi:GDP-fucose transporter nac [Rhodnius prolixus]|uniref:Putative gdp-fucose transporter n=1 Tax=Rhodnius prolixus TaxID=13249 RepID=R4G3I0_RHOPR